MIPPLLRLPAVALGGDDLNALGALATSLGGHTVVVGPQRRTDGALLDEFVVAAGVRAVAPAATLGVAARVGAGRAASIVAREATAAQLLGACAVLLLEGEPTRCADAATVIEALLTGGAHVVTTDSEHVDGARNLPLPDAALPVVWADGDALMRLEDGEPTTCGTVVVREAAHGAPPPRPGTLVVVVAEHDPVGVAELAGVLA
ncbi:MAG TPA: hypothetical protein VKT18_07350 [Acidimicrobiales bacterium]|nr:hypothetical protein [Acidimicrobiales bacterium]